MLPNNKNLSILIVVCFISSFMIIMYEYSNTPTYADPIFYSIENTPTPRTQEVIDYSIEFEYEELTRININTATVEELTLLNGIGEVTAIKIIEYRLEHGDFVLIEDIMYVSGIGLTKFEAIKDCIYV